MLSPRGLERVAGALLAASFLTFAGHVLTLFAFGFGQLTILLVLVYGFFVFLSGTLLYFVFRGEVLILALFGAAGFAAHGLLVIVTCAFLFAELQFPDALAGIAADRSIVQRAHQITMDMIRSAAFVFLGLGLGLFGTLIARHAPVSRWIGWLGIVSGVVAVPSLVARLTGVEVVALPILAILMFAFLAALGVRLMTHGAHTGSQPSATPSA